MNRSTYLRLRFAIENEVAETKRSGVSDESAHVNNLMRIFLSVIADQEVARQRSAQKFKTFRRDYDAVAPSWAFRKPGFRPKYEPVR